MTSSTACTSIRLSTILSAFSSNERTARSNGRLAGSGLATGTRWGYGRICLSTRKGPRNRQAHRVSYFEHKGLPYRRKTPFLLHKCDRAACIHPDHVDPGTHRLNMQQMRERGRHGNRWGNVANGYGRLEPVEPEVALSAERQPGED